MIVYDRLWETHKTKEITQYTLINKYHVSTGLLDRLRKNLNVNTYSLNTLCSILKCSLEDIAQFIDDDNESIGS